MLLLNSRKIEHLHPDLQPLCRLLLERCAAAGYDVFLTQTFRSTEYQNMLYAQGRTQAQLNAAGLGHVMAEPSKPRVTNARGGSSEHNATLNGIPASRAFDIAFMRDGKASWADSEPWDKVGAIGRSLGLEWGGDWKTFKDRPHFQLPKSR
ncbi:M15 family metallopeptidase [Caldimonas thermodepolymerans]|nr:M15 family metallopeptidase [Caldimonas thermodepolymerans]RDH97011.1 peptidoglycan L-alanyl-D-glutamate endopeptidase CwlK [Caldimonas thermodepolymerans]